MAGSEGQVRIEVGLGRADRISVSCMMPNQIAPSHQVVGGYFLTKTISKGGVIVWSQYLRIRERNGVVAVFHELHPDPVYYSSEQWKKLVNEITDGTEMLIDDLRQRKLIVESPNDDCREFDRVASDIERKLDQSTILYLMTAQGCNFGCEYCPIPETAKKHGTSLLSVEDALAGIE